MLKSCAVDRDFDTCMQSSVFFSCDWGSTHFRLRLVDRVSGAVLAQSRKGDGIRHMNNEFVAGSGDSRHSFFAGFVRREISGMVEMLCAQAPDTPLLASGFWNRVPVVISGMASSTVGWCELPYGPLPCGLDGHEIPHARVELFPAGTGPSNAWLVSGLCNDRDVMRGEETELVGLFGHGRHEPIARKGWVVLPGTHSKHVKLEGARIVDVRTFMTGELYDVLSQHSLLKVSVQAKASTSLQEDSESRQAFFSGVESSQRQGLAASLFQVRTNTVLKGKDPSQNRWFLSGLLVGGELDSLCSSRNREPILLAASGELGEAYSMAFDVLGVRDGLVVASQEEMTFAAMRGQEQYLRSWGDIDKS